MKIKRTILAPVLVASFAMATGGWFLQQGLGEERSVYANARLFEDVMGHVSQYFVDGKPSGELYRMAIDGMLEKLGDPHTQVMPAQDYERLRLATQGEYGGIGVQIDKRGDWITVISPLPGTPGMRAGLTAGDQIIEVDGESTKGWDTDLAVNKLRGPKGSRVNVVLSRGGEQIPLQLTREEIHILAVPVSYMMPGNVGYVELLSFSESSTDELKKAVEKLRAEGARGIILDLRRNPGGLLDQGVSVSDLFLDRGQVVVETKGRAQDQNRRDIARTPDQFPGLPIVVLVEPSSASASEIVAGALQDHDRALVLGRTTYGKGSVQTLLPLDDENWLKITTARWYTPVGRTIQKPYGIDAPHPTEMGDQPRVTMDSTKLPEYRTDGGRTVFGGGGIHPDLIVHPDTLTADEKTYRLEVQKHLQEYINARMSYSVQFLRQNPGLQPGFAVTQEMLDGFYQQLQRSGVEVERDIYERASKWVASDLGYEITYSKWGEQTARQRVNSEDAQVRAAADLIRQASSPKSLFDLAAKRPVTQRTDANAPAPR